MKSYPARAAGHGARRRILILTSERQVLRAGACVRLPERRVGHVVVHRAGWSGG